MALSAGTRFGSYEVVSLLGAGGMGEVYRARDTRLGRDVAVKVLPTALSHDRTRLDRFEREARLLAALSHPYIATIHGVEEGETIALVMELVEGPTLADRIARGPLQLQEALTIGSQIAEALEAAHEKGIIHRDLKPANIKLTKQGHVKVLDFGLARAVAPDDSAARSEASTITASEHGWIVGTPAYMSPEQARGQAVDKQTDVWSFGCVLFELLTGCKAFGGDTTSDSIAAVLTRDPDWDLLPKDVPPSTRQLLQRCLQKDARQRQRDIGDVRLELAHGRVSAARPGDERSVEATVRRRPDRSPWLIPGAAGAVLLVAAVAMFALRQFHAIPESSEPPVQLTDFTDTTIAPALSHDGRMLTFVRGGSFGRTAPNGGQLYVKLLPNGAPIQLTSGRGGAGYPAFSADDSRIIYTVVMPGLKWDSWQVPVLGGAPQPFLPNASGLVWLDDRRLVYSSIEAGLHMGIVSSTESRSENRNVYFPASPGGMAHRSSPSPNGKSLLVIEMERGTWLPCRLLPSDGSSIGGPVGPASGQCTSAAWSPDGRWMYFSSNAGGSFHIWRQRYPNGASQQITFGPTEQEGTAVTADGKYLITSMGLTRASVSLTDASGGVRPFTDEGYAIQPTMSASGARLLYLMRTKFSQGQASGELWSLDVNTRTRGRLLPGFVMTNYALSHDGTKVVFTSSGSDAGGDGIWIADVDRRNPSRQLTHAGESRAFFGRPGEIVYMGADSLLHTMNEDGSDSRVVSDAPIVYLLTVSPDGRWAAVIIPQTTSGGGTRIEFRSLQGEESYPVCNDGCGLGPRSVLEVLPFNWSSDGKWLFVNLVLYDKRAPRTIVLPYRSDVPLERLWPKGLASEEDAAANPGARLINAAYTFPTSNPATYLVWSTTTQSNLYKVRIPN